MNQKVNSWAYTEQKCVHEHKKNLYKNFHHHIICNSLNLETNPNVSPTVDKESTKKPLYTHPVEYYKEMKRNEPQHPKCHPKLIDMMSRERSLTQKSTYCRSL